jgi:hypothetical protein
MAVEDGRRASRSARGRVDEGRVRVVRGLALGTGALFLVAGIAGFAITGFEGFAQETYKTLLWFEVNPLHNLVHLLVGALGLLLGWTLGGARAFGWVLAIGYGAAAAYGVLAAGEPGIDVLSLNWADNWLHVASAALGLVIALLPVRRGRPDGSALGDEESAGRYMAR